MRMLKSVGSLFLLVSFYSTLLRLHTHTSETNLFHHKSIRISGQSGGEEGGRTRE